MCELQMRYDDLQKKSNVRITHLEQQEKRLTKELKVAMAELKKQQENVVMPLVAECAKREKQLQEMFKELSERTKSLKIVYAMIRSPRMCDLLYKAERKKFSADRIKAMQDRAVSTLRLYEFDEK